MAKIEKYLIDTNILITHLRKPELVDALIASTAIEYNLALVTLNYKDFDKISDLELFRI